MLKIGFIGLGHMGAPMVRNVAKAGFEVVVFDANPSVSESVANEINAHSASKPADFYDVDIVITMLPTSRIVSAALLDWEEGIPAYLNRGAVVIDMSSSDPTETIELGLRLAESGIGLIDAPVSGGMQKAEAGTLSIMLGGDRAEDIERAVPIIETMSSAIFRTGKLGTGHAMKALNNYVAAAATTATYEALVTGERFGLDPQTIVDILNASTGQSWASTNVVGPQVITRKFNSGFALGLYAKDVAIAKKLTASMNQPAPICGAVSKSLNDAFQHLGNIDHAAAITYWEQLQN